MKLPLLLLLLILGGCKSKSLDRASEGKRGASESAADKKYEVTTGGCSQSGGDTGWHWPRRADGHCYLSDLGSPAAIKDLEEYMATHDYKTPIEIAPPGTPVSFSSSSRVVHPNRNCNPDGMEDLD